MYRDDINAAPFVTMPIQINVGIYEIGTNNPLPIVLVPRIDLGFVNLGDPCFNPDPDSLRIEEGIFETAVTVNIPDFANGYYFHTQIFARNNIINNLRSPSNDFGMSFYAEIADPALGANSTPDFGDYPADAFLCVASNKTYSFSVTEADGDSLVYSLVDPLNGFGTAMANGNGSFAGSGAYPYYPSTIWNTTGGFSLSNIVGGTTPMSIDPETGIITASPANAGVYVFAVRIEEFRNGIKMGEVRRDVQYTGLLCDMDTPPIDLTGINDSTLFIPFAQEFCQDIIFEDIDVTDTIFLEITSPVLTEELSYLL